MIDFCNAHRFPRAHIDPIDDMGARVLIDSLLGLPPRGETLVILLDAERRGLSIVHVSDTREPEDVYDVTEFVVGLAAREPEVAGVILASVRPAGTDDVGDVERWLDLDERFTLAGLEVVEWYVYGRSVSLPRVLLGEPSRWAA